MISVALRNFSTICSLLPLHLIHIRADYLLCFLTEIRLDPVTQLKVGLLFGDVFGRMANVSRNPTWKRNRKTLLPFEHADVRLTFSHDEPGHSQALEIGRKLDVLRVQHLAIDLVSHFENMLVHPAYRGRR